MLPRRAPTPTSTACSTPPPASTTSGPKRPPWASSQGAPIVAKAWADIFTEDYGGEIDYSTVAQYLVRDDDNTGRVSAVIAQDADGNYIKYEATKAVVLATGDFSKDFDMMARFAPYAWEHFKDVLTPEVDYDAEMIYTGLMPGTGQKMGLWVGAAWQKTFPNPCAINGAISGRRTASSTRSGASTWPRTAAASTTRTRTSRSAPTRA